MDTAPVTRGGRVSSRGNAAAYQAHTIAKHVMIMPITTREMSAAEQWRQRPDKRNERRQTSMCVLLSLAKRLHVTSGSLVTAPQQRYTQYLQDDGSTQQGLSTVWETNNNLCRHM